MDSQMDPDQQLTSQLEGSSTGTSGAFFPNGENFVVSGGNFTNIINTSPEDPSDFRRIPLGDLILKEEVRSGIVYRRGSRSSIKHVYLARVADKSSNMTVAVYHGPQAEEDWKDAIQQYYSIRHPNIAQLFGTVKSGPFYATIFHDDLIPFEKVAWAKNSPLVAAYLDYYLSMELPGVISAYRDVTGMHVNSSYEMNGTLCVYRSNSRMCFDMSPRIGGGMYYKQDEESNPLPRVQMYPLDVTDSMVISFLTLQHYHEIVSCSQRSDTSSIGVHPAVSIPELGALITGIPRSGELLEDPIQVAAVSNRTAKLSGWHGNMRSGQSMLMPNGWTRYQMSEVMTIGSAINSAVDYPCAYPWVTQANHIFSRLGNSKKSGKDFALLREVMYGLDLEGGTRASRRPQNAYIFLCPEKELRRQDGTGFRYPPCPAYWSFDPTGVEKLSEEKARNLGFPTINLRMHIWAYTWSKGVYEGIRKFQQGKGFDSDSQDVAVQLGVPLYELSVQRDFFAHADDRTESSEDTEDSADDDNLGPPGMVIYATDNGSFSLQSGSGTRPSTFQMDIVINDPDPSMFAHVDDLGSNDGSESEVELPAPTPDISDNDEQLETLSPEHNEIEQSDNGNNAVQPVLGNSEAGINLVNFEKPVDMSKPSKSRLDLKISMLNRKMWFFAALGLALGLITFQNYIVNFYKVPATVGGPDKTGLARAIERAQTLETWLDDESLVTFIELLARDSGTVETYNALHRGSVRVEWVRRKLGRE